MWNKVRSLPEVKIYYVCPFLPTYKVCHSVRGGNWIGITWFVGHKVMLLITHHSRPFHVLANWLGILILWLMYFLSLLELGTHQCNLGLLWTCIYYLFFLSKDKEFICFYNSEIFKKKVTPPKGLLGYFISNLAFVWRIKRNYIFHFLSRKGKYLLNVWYVKDTLLLGCVRVQWYLRWSEILYKKHETRKLKNNWQWHFVWRRGKRKTIKLLVGCMLKVIGFSFMPDCPVILNSDSQILFVYSFRIEFELFLNWLLPEFIIFLHPQNLW